MVAGDGSCASVPSWALLTGANGGLAFYASLQTGTESLDFVATGEVPAAQIFNGQWHAVAVTFSAGVAALWVDGAVAGSATGAHPSIFYPAARRGLSVGRDPDCYNRGFPGDVDEVREYNRKLTDADPVPPAPGLHLATGPPGRPDTDADRVTPAHRDRHAGPDPEAEPEPDLAFKWHLDKAPDFPGETFDDKVFDYSGNGHHGTVGAGGFITGGRFGSAFELPDAPADPVGVSTTGSAQFEPTAITLLAWVRGTNPATGAVIAEYGAPICGGTGYELAVNQGDLYFSVNEQDLGLVVSPRKKVFDGQWHAVAGTYDGDARAAVRRRREVGTVGAPGRSSRRTTARCASAGTPWGTAGSRRAFHGDVDEVRLYDRALTDGELAYLPGGSTARRRPCRSRPARTTEPPDISASRVATYTNCNPGTWTVRPPSTTCGSGRPGRSGSRATAPGPRSTGRTSNVHGAGHRRRLAHPLPRDRDQGRDVRRGVSTLLRVDTTCRRTEPRRLGDASASAAITIRSRASRRMEERGDEPDFTYPWLDTTAKCSAARPTPSRPGPAAAVLPLQDHPRRATATTTSSAR